MVSPRLAALTVVALFVAGCSGSGDGVTTSTGSVTPPMTETTAPPVTETTVPPTTETTGLPVIIDTDVALDDAMAILYLLRRPDIEIVAVTVSGTGVAYCDAGVAIVLGLLAVGGEDQVPVACGAEIPLEGANAFPKAWRGAMDTIAASGVFPPGGNPVTDDAPSLIATAVSESPAPPVILVLGPHTNLAQALRDHPDLASEIAAIHLMGGAVEAAGNTFDNPRAEWNLWIDPVADAEVFATDIPVSIVPLDATAAVPLTTWFADRLAEHLTTPEAQAVHDLLTADPTTLSSGLSFWDQLAAVTLVESAVATWQELDVTVLQQGGPENAGTLAAGMGRPATVAMAADREAFESEYLSTLTGEEVAASEWDTDATLTVSDAGWDYDGPITVEPGLFTVIVDNQSEQSVVVVHGWLIGDATWEDLDAYSGSGIEQPPFLEVAGFALADPRIETIWTIDFSRSGQNALIGLDLGLEEMVWSLEVVVDG
ncbi:MAG: nucleoside hydrolase [Actinomycetota bacterium]|nr:nucleoside hydrolase [Actinomycetota bacterium]